MIELLNVESAKSGKITADEACRRVSQYTLRYRYVTDPYQVWRGYNKSKKYAAFNAKTLTQKDGVIDRKLRLMLSRREEFEGSLKTSNHDLD
ncbi:hypothetical protein GUB47_26855 [Escherichia coli]|nr:hypothetical protein [Escherichia coli]